MADDMTPHLAKADLKAAFTALGLSAGSGVMVHSSLRSFGYVEGGPLTVIEALMETLTPEGTLLFPSFNHALAFQEGAPGVYDPLVTPTVNGAIPDRFWRLPGVWRSLDPSHAFAAWGRNARRYIENHHRTLTLGPQSPLGLLRADGGYGLLLGTGYGSNTFHHVVETTLGSPCLGARTEGYPVLLPGGRRVLGRTWGWRETACPITDHTVYQEEMRACDRRARIGNCEAILYKLEDCFTVVARMLSEGYHGAPPCSRCPIRPRRIPENVPSDWDAEAQCLLPDSVAWTYSVESQETHD